MEHELLHEQSDEELFKMFRSSGDRNALGELYVRYAPKLHIFLKKYVGNISDIDDVIQDAFSLVMQRAETFDGRRKFGPWLYGIAHHVAHGYQRKKRPMFLEEFSEVGRMELLGDEVDPPLLSLVQEECREILRSLLSDLPEHERKMALLLSEGLHLRAIARTLQIPWGTAYYRLRLMRESLQRKLVAAGFDEMTLQEVFG